MILHIADGLSLPVNAVTQTFGILAVRGAGKSNAAAVMAEEMFAAKLPFVVIDPVGAWYGLRSSGDGKGPGLGVPIFGGRHGDVPLERGAGQLLADLIVDDRLSCVLDVSEFSEGDKVRFLTDFAERLYRKNEDPLHLFLEEADDYIPQRPFREQARCLRAWENIVRRGRARGLGITMISQRSAAINKNVLTQIETLIVLRTTSPQDRKAIEAWVEYHGQSRELLESLSGLRDGEAWVWSPHWLKAIKRVQIRRRETFDSGATPKDVKGKRPPATLADVDLQAVHRRMADTIERAKAEDPRELRRQLAELKAELVRVKSQAPTPAEPKVVEVPIFTEAERKGLEVCAKKISEARNAVEAILGRVDAQLSALLVKANRRTEQLSTVQGVRPNPGNRRFTETVKSQPRPVRSSGDSPRSSGIKSDFHLSKGERAILAAIAQYPEGAARDQLSVLTGYRRSSRDTYIQRIREAGLVEDRGGLLRATREGIGALGVDFEPLPTGTALQEYWRQRLGQGEWAILEILIQAYPKAVDRGALDEPTGYKRSSRDTYLQRLGSRRLIEMVGRGEVRAAETLFLER